MFVEEDHFFHKLIVALKKPNLSHVSKQEKQNRQSLSIVMIYIRKPTGHPLYMSQASAFITKIGIWVRDKHWELSE